MNAATNRNELQPREEDKIERAVAAVLTSPRLEDAARSLGVDRTTLWRLSERPEFQARLREARAHLSAEVVGALQANTLEAVGVLREVMNDRATPASGRVSAASKLIELGLRAKDQLEMEQRVAALEAALKAKVAGMKNAEKPATERQKDK